MKTCTIVLRKRLSTSYSNGDNKHIWRQHEKHVNASTSTPPRKPFFFFVANIIKPTGQKKSTTEVLILISHSTTTVHNLYRNVNSDVKLAYVTSFLRQWQTATAAKINTQK